MPTPARAYAVESEGETFTPISFERRDLLPDDVAIEIAYCGICHSDLHTARGEWGIPDYPCVPGHEIIGRVTAVGEQVSRFEVGEMVGVGCMVGSCGHCAACHDGEENYCTVTGFIGTYAGKDAKSDGLAYHHTLGGYSDRIVVADHFVFKIGHDEKDLPAVAPLLCAGITTYAPLKRFGAGPGKVVGVVGIGGLGHMALKIARAMGAHVVAFTTSESKREDALKLGAHEVVVSRDADQMGRQAGKLDLILNAVAAPHDLDAFLVLLKRGGTMVMLGVPDSPHPSPNVGNLIFRRAALAGSLIGGVPETQEMLDFCRDHGIVADIEIIPIQNIETAYERMLKSDVKYRFVIDMGSLKQDG